MKRYITIMLIISFTLLLALPGCGLQPAQKENDGSTAQPSQETAAPTISGPAESSAAAVTESPEPELPPARAIVFDDTIDVQSSADTPFDGETALSLTLFETSPGSYKGGGMLTRPLEMQMQGNKIITNSSYRLNYSEVRPDEAGQFMMTTCMAYDQDMNWAGIAELGVQKVRLLITQQKPAEYKLTVDGDLAQMHIKIDNLEFVFQGGCTQLSPGKPKPELDVLEGRCISINSTFYENGNEYNDEYRAMLTATQTSAYEYAGDLCVYGSGKDIPFVDEAVSFKMEPFDMEAYTDAGGKLSGSFDAFGVIHTSAGDYIVLLDGDRPLVELAGSEIAFYGTLLPADQSDKARYVASETKQLMRTLYDGCDKTKHSISATTGHWDGKPPWYPDWLMPEPTKTPYNFSWKGSANELGFNRYEAQYAMDGVIITDVFEDFKAQLAGSDGFEAYDNFEDNIAGYGNLEGAQATIYFTRGAYNISIMLAQSPAFVGVLVSIT